MPFNPFLYLSNRNGIPRIATSSVSVGTDAVTFTIPSNNAFYNNSNAGTKEVTVLGGGDWTVADYLTGIHLMYFESETGTLQLLV